MPADHEYAALLLSSDATIRYADDILTALAMPSGTWFQFRYASQYVEPALQQIVRSREIVGRRVLVAFISKEKDFLIPVRSATVASVKIAADILQFKLVAGEIPNIQEFPTDRPGIQKDASDYLDRMQQMNNHQHFAASSRFPALKNLRDSSDQNAAWLDVARRLAQHPTFSDAHFVRVESLRRDDGTPLAASSDGTLTLVEGEMVRMPVNYYAETYTTDNRKISCSADEKFVRLASDDTLPVASRYDSVEFWLHPQTVSGKSLTRLALALKGDSEVNVSRVNLMLQIRQAQGQLAMRLALGAVGSFLIALPGILGPKSALELRIAVAVAGALILSFVAVYLTVGRK